MWIGEFGWFDKHHNSNKNRKQDSDTRNKGHKNRNSGINCRNSGTFNFEKLASM
jgi:hypothetical protein